MSKFDPLHDYLVRRTGTVTMTLDEIANMITGGLPPSAFQYEVWWRNDDSTHSHCQPWGVPATSRGQIWPADACDSTPGNAQAWPGYGRTATIPGAPRLLPVRTVDAGIPNQR